MLLQVRGHGAQRLTSRSSADTHAGQAGGLCMQGAEHARVFSQHFCQEPEQYRYHDGMAREAREEPVELS